MALINGLYYFDLSECEEQENIENRLAYGNACVVFGGVVLPTLDVSARTPKYEIKTRTWLTRGLAGIKDKRKTEKRNKDGSITIIEEWSYVRSDGTKVKEMTESTFDPNYNQLIALNENPYPNLEMLFDAVAVKNRGSHTTTVTQNTPRQFPREVVRTTVTQPPASVTETVEQTTAIYQPTYSDGPSPETVRRKKKFNRQVFSSEPLQFIKPVGVTSCLGEIIYQYKLPNPQPLDVNYFNDEMNSQSTASPSAFNFTAPHLQDSDDEEVFIDRQNNLKRTSVFKEVQDQDGNLQKILTVSEEPYTDELAILEEKESQEGRELTTSVTETPLKQTQRVESYNRHNELTKTVDTVTTRTPTRESSETTETNSDGTSTKRSSIRTVSEDGTETLNETETTKRDAVTVVTTRSDSVDYDQGIRTVTLTKDTTQLNGDTVRDEKVFKYNTAQKFSTIELVTETFDDSIVNEVVYGYLINEVVVSGEVMQASLAYKMIDKNLNHQTAWGMYELLNQQLELGDRLSDSMKKKLYEDQVRIFSGNDSLATPVRGGNVLDRIGLEVFGEVYTGGCVFANGSGADFKWQEGTQERIFKWTLTLHIYESLVKDTDIAKIDTWLDLQNKGINRLPGVYGYTPGGIN